MSLPFNMHLPLSEKLVFHPWSGVYHSEFLLWCKINAQDWQVTETFMTCLTMREGLILWFHACTKFAFYNDGFIDSNDGPFTIQEMWLRGKARFLIMLTSWGSSWTLDLLVIWTVWISWTFGSLEGAIGFLSSRTFANLDPLPIWTAWIFWQFGSLCGP